MADRKWPESLLLATDCFVDSRQPDWHLNACVGTQLPDAYAHAYYSDGFKRAACSLVTQVVDGHTLDLPIDVVVYPIIFLYRHHFELLLKLLIVAGRNLLSETGANPFGHRLDQLWATSRPIVERCFTDVDWSQNDNVTALICELSGLDPNGEAGRYPENSKGVKYFQGLSLLNIRHFADVAERLSEYLSVVLSALEGTTEQRREWEADMLSDYVS